MVNGNTDSQTQIESLVVHVDQLVPENMERLAKAGYRIARDPNLLIFVRVVPPPQHPSTEQDTQSAAVTPVAEEGR